tara:strand:- start:1164 stop:2291 length:1128 start_codon:yes stop_codon:yes gene_type:complete
MNKYKIKKKLYDSNVAIVSFFTALPSWHGAADLTSLMFKYFPAKSKRLFQFTDFKNNTSKFKKVTNINIFINFPIAKIFFIIFLIYKLKKYLLNKKKRIVVIEGASWTFFSYIVIKYLKKYFKDIKIIYHSHNVDYEVRKLKNSNFILYFTKYFEKKILEISDFSTAVSKTDQLLFRKIYNIKTLILENGIDKINLNNYNSKLKLPKNYIFFPGSYTYYPNKLAIDEIINFHLKNLNKKFPNYYFIFSGEGLPENYQKIKNVKYFGIMNKKDYYYVLKNSKFVFMPLKNAPGTKIKTLESLVMKKIILGTKFAFKGIKINRDKSIVIYKNKNEVIEKISYIIKNYKKIKNNNLKNLKKHYFENIIINFAKKYLYE